MESVVTVLTSLFLFTGGRHILKPTCEHDMFPLIQCSDITEQLRAQH